MFLWCRVKGFDKTKQTCSAETFCTHTHTYLYVYYRYMYMFILANVPANKNVGTFANATRCPLIKALAAMALGVP